MNEVSLDECVMTAESTPAGRVAVVIPCRNEEAAIARVIVDFRDALPGAQIVVLDNGSTDNTGQVARDNGAKVILERRPGKGLAMQRLFADVEADCYLMVDGDDTYDSRSAREMVDMVLNKEADMVLGVRVIEGGGEAEFRRGHQLGNKMLTWIFSSLFQLQLSDTLSGYRALSRRFVKSFPLATEGFEVEAELNVHAALLGVPIAEVEGLYTERAVGTESKLNTYKDGIRILRRNLRLFRDARPLMSFGIISIPFWIIAAILIGIPFYEYVQTGVVARFPSLIAGLASFTAAVQLLIGGIIMERVARNRYETARIRYLEG